MNRAHQLALGGERHLANPREALLQFLVGQAGFARGHDQRTLGRVALNPPAPVALLQDGVVGAVSRAECVGDFGAQRPFWERMTILP